MTLARDLGMLVRGHTPVSTIHHQTEPKLELRRTPRGFELGLARYAKTMNIRPDLTAPPSRGRRAAFQRHVVGGDERASVTGRHLDPELRVPVEAVLDSKVVRQPQLGPRRDRSLGLHIEPQVPNGAFARGFVHARRAGVMRMGERDGVPQVGVHGRTPLGLGLSIGTTDQSEKQEELSSRPHPTWLHPKGHAAPKSSPSRAPEGPAGNARSLVRATQRLW